MGFSYPPQHSFIFQKNINEFVYISDFYGSKDPNFIRYKQRFVWDTPFLGLENKIFISRYEKFGCLKVPSPETKNVSECIWYKIAYLHTFCIFYVKINTDKNRTIFKNFVLVSLQGLKFKRFLRVKGLQKLSKPLHIDVVPHH